MIEHDQHPDLVSEFLELELLFGVVLQVRSEPRAYEAPKRSALSPEVHRTAVGGGD